jgi:hypothetical protein
VKSIILIKVIYYYISASLSLKNALSTITETSLVNPSDAQEGHLVMHSESITHAQKDAFLMRWDVIQGGMDPYLTCGTS